MKSFKEDEIIQLYNSQIKLDDSYFTKYTNLGACPVKSWNYSWNGKDFPRTWCVKDFIEWTQKHNLTHINTLGYTCDTDPELEFVSAHTKHCLSYPSYDLHIRHEAFINTFDFLIFNQTIEHYVFTSVPTLNIPHSTPIHFNGYNPMGLAMLFKCAGFEVVEIGQWGNYDYISQLWRSHHWPSYETLQSNGQVTNERDNVCQCWILVKKPE